ncbi:restriction endonuclease subunit S [Paenibacillus sp. P46E]|uniref:restriction endonuclease subunit S n=1 Tax=Paenibacillus sp. P46E TaxID=1349436 RepID=UPI0009394553|nr:restriction endonuclease subunit S [Paenibacillus sp. P46E]
MKLKYKRLGDYIKEINVRNTELNVNNLLGINIDKYFMSSVANIVGTDMTTYKIVKNGQFACNRMHVGRDKRLPVALSKQVEDVIVSPAYNVFEIIDKEALDPEYLMMWFLRREFDRNAWFYTDADVRGGLNWKDFCNMQLPVPSISKQKETVKEYNVLIKRINLNKQLIQKSEETARAIYKQWFIDFEFPDENGKPYKSKGGVMEFNNELDKEIPKGWNLEKLGNLINYKKGFAFQSNDYTISGVPIVRVSDFKDKTIDTRNCNYLDVDQAQEYSQYRLKTNDIIISTVGSWPNNPLSIVGKIVIVPELANNSLLNQNAVRLRATKTERQLFLYYRLIEKDFSDFILSGAQGSANQASVTLEHLFNFNVLIPSSEIGAQLYSSFNMLNKNIMIKEKENYFLESLKNILLSKIATLEDNL